MMGLEEEGEGGDWGDRLCKRQGLCVTTGHRQRGRDSQDEAGVKVLFLWHQEADPEQTQTFA